MIIPIKRKIKRKIKRRRLPCRTRLIKLLFFIVNHQTGIKIFHTLRADAVGKGSIRIFSDVSFNLFPVPAIIANLFTGGTNGQQSAQSFNLGKGCLKFFEGLLQFLDENFSFLFSLLALSYIIADTKNLGDVAVLI